MGPLLKDVRIRSKEINGIPLPTTTAQFAKLDPKGGFYKDFGRETGETAAFITRSTREKEEAKERLEGQPAGERHRHNREVNFRASGAREYDRRRPTEIETYSRRGRDAQERNKYPPRHHPYARSTRENSRDRGSQQHSSFFQRHVQTSYQPRDQNSQERVHKPISKDTNSQEQGSDRRARSTRSQGFGSHREGNEPSTEPARNRAELSPLVGGAPPTGNSNSVPKDAVELAIVEVREAMAQYTACADPTKSAARKERMRLAEAQGEIEETAIRMVQASKGTTPTRSPPVEIPARIPAVLRLGPSPQEETRTDGNPEPPTKRKPGKPPGKRRTQESPLKITGPLAAKRRVVQKAQTGKRRTVKGITQTPRGTNGTTFWDHPMIQQIFPAMADTILSIKPSSLGAPDKLFWIHTRDGVYTIKSGYTTATIP
ncbi:hypothetical protein HID58_012489 [Brassica napus]|uniref:Uncharacterized protein n=1 Tax=Brassica napus TaxID=3708 RepID=A0ABQ8E171_BRANA|nr:hypothetical protein HID58_012489 [Brassica napus]